MQKKLFYSLLVLALAVIASLVVPNLEVSAKEGEVLSKSELLEKGVNPKKVDTLHKKIEKGQKLDSERFIENNENLILSTNENKHFKKEFADGSFVETKITDITEIENASNGGVSTQGIDWIGGQSEYRTLQIQAVFVYGVQEFKVKVYYPLIGYSEILQAYDWYYNGSFKGTDWRGIYRARETISKDAVAIQRLVSDYYGYGAFISKVEFRMRDGRYWLVKFD